jgi:hypothetical protein
MTVQEFKKFKDWHNKLESVRKAKYMLDGIFKYTKPRVSDLPPIIEYLESLSLGRQKEIFQMLLEKTEEEINELEIEFKNSLKTNNNEN